MYDMNRRAFVFVKKIKYVIISVFKGGTKNMHFTTLYIMRGKTLEDVCQGLIENEFCDRFCYCCGATRPRYKSWCDWFQIGGRWNDAGVLKATRGFVGDNGVGDNYDKPTYSVCEIKDLVEDIDIDMIYAIATQTRIIEDKEEIKKYLDKINSKQIKGVVALIDCHD